MLTIDFRTVKKAAHLRSNIESTITTARAIEYKLNNWYRDAFVGEPQDGTSLTPTTRGTGVLRIASIYCYILIHRTLLKITLGTPFFDRFYKNAVQYTSRVFFQLESLTLLDMESFWFSCELQLITAIRHQMLMTRQGREHNLTRLQTSWYF